MQKSTFRRLLLAAVLVAAAWQSIPAEAACTRYCWHVSAEESCCRLFSCEIVCG